MFNIYNIMPSKQKTKKHNKLKKKRGKKYTRNQKRKKRRSQKGGNWLTKFIFDRGNKEGKKEEKKEEEKTGLQGFDAQLDGMFNMFKQNVKKTMEDQMSKGASMAKNTGLGLIGASDSGLTYEFLEKTLDEYFKDPVKAKEVITFIKEKKEKKEGKEKLDGENKKEEKDLDNMLNEVNKKPDAPPAAADGKPPTSDASDGNDKPPAGDAPAGDAPAAGNDAAKKDDFSVLETADIDVTMDDSSEPMKLNDDKLKTEELK